FMACAACSNSLPGSMPLAGAARTVDDLLIEDDEAPKASKRARPASNAPAWQDDDEEEAKERVSAAQYGQELREQYEARRGPRPGWAERAAEETAATGLLGTTASVTKSGTAVGTLEAGVVRIQKLANLNAQAPSTVDVDNVQFAPGAQVALT